MFGYDKPKTHVYVDQEVADAIEGYDEPAEQIRAIHDVMKRKAMDFEQDQEIIEENLLSFKAYCLSHKKELQKVYIEQSELTYKLWQDMCDAGFMEELRNHSRNIASEVAVVSKEVKEATEAVQQLKRELDGLNIYGSERFLELINTVSNLDGGAKNMLKFLLNGYDK